MVQENGSNPARGFLQQKPNRNNNNKRKISIIKGDQVSNKLLESNVDHQVP
jgi:hypothetical protein